MAIPKIMKVNDQVDPGTAGGIDARRRRLLQFAGSAAFTAGTQMCLPGSLLAAESRKHPPAGALDRFHPPAMIQDLAGQPELQTALDQAWNINANGWTQQAILGNPWTSLYASDQNYYYNPLDTDLSHGLQQMVSWPAFPNHIGFYYPELSLEQQWEFADTGTVAGFTAPNTPQPALCAAQGGQPIGPYTKRIPYTPYGPRGWLDEYCEMSYEMNAGEVVRVHFTCENPEYWYTLWSVDPERAAEIYRHTLGNQSIRREDLELRVNGQPVIDPATGRAAYNPLNKWNSGPVMSPEAGGAMHLTSTPNTIQTELQLAAGATVQRSQGNENATDLICCAVYGQIYRNSDPHIGQITNQVVGAGYRVSLADPIGLYIQLPDFNTWDFADSVKSQLPVGAMPSDCYHILRGRETLEEFAPVYNFILHARVEAPESWRAAGISLQDLVINGNPFRYASQILQTFDVALFPLGVPAEVPAPQAPCVYSLPSGSNQPTHAFPQQIMYQELWNAYYGKTYTVPFRQQSNGGAVTMNLASNTVIIAPRVRRGQTGVLLAVTGSAFARGTAGHLPHAEFLLPGSTEADDRIHTEVLALDDVVYALPGNSEPGTQQLLKLRVDIAVDALLHQRDLRVTNPGQTSAVPARFFLWVLPVDGE